jgi:CBS-domain-containing membrane protein
MVKAAMLSTLRVRDVMTEALLLLRAETPIAEAWKQLHDAAVTGAPVLNAKGRLVGVLSNYDLADPRRRLPEGLGTVGDVMTRLVYAVRAEDPALTAVRLMLDENIHRAVVVNEDGSLAGIVVPMDILRILASSEEAHIEYVDLRKLRGEDH